MGERRCATPLELKVRESPLQGFHEQYPRPSVKSAVEISASFALLRLNSYRELGLCAVVILIE